MTIQQNTDSFIYIIVEQLAKHIRQFVESNRFILENLISRILRPRHQLDEKLTYFKYISHLKDYFIYNFSYSNLAPL